MVVVGPAAGLRPVRLVGGDQDAHLAQPGHAVSMSGMGCLRPVHIRQDDGGDAEAVPAAHLLTVWKVAGVTAMPSAGGSDTDRRGAPCRTDRVAGLGLDSRRVHETQALRSGDDAHVPVRLLGGRDQLADFAGRAYDDLQKRLLGLLVRLVAHAGTPT